MLKIKTSAVKNYAKQGAKGAAIAGLLGLLFSLKRDNKTVKRILYSLLVGATVSIGTDIAEKAINKIKEG